MLPRSETDRLFKLVLLSPMTSPVDSMVRAVFKRTLAPYERAEVETRVTAIRVLWKTQWWRKL